MDYASGRMGEQSATAAGFFLHQGPGIRRLARRAAPLIVPPLVSIIIPCHNAEPWLEATLLSALGQTWPRTEIIFVDDGSSDGSVAVARRFAARGVRVESTPHRGASAARNHGLRIARGEFSQFLDADDILAPEKIERQVARLGAAPAGTVASGSLGAFFWIAGGGGFFIPSPRGRT